MLFCVNVLPTIKACMLARISVSVYVRVEGRGGACDPAERKTVTNCHH